MRYQIDMFYLQQGERMSKSEVQAILDDADTNNDGKLDYVEVKCNNSHLMLSFINAIRYYWRMNNIQVRPCAAFQKF